MLNDLPDVLEYAVFRENFHSMDYSPNLADFKELERACMVIHKQKYKRIDNYTPLSERVAEEYPRISYLFTSKNPPAVRRMQQWLTHYNFDLFAWDSRSYRLYPDWVTRLNELEHFVLNERHLYIHKYKVAKWFLLGSFFILEMVVILG